MTWSEAAVVALILVAVVCWRMWIAASRLDRLHRKVAASRLALDAQLVRRASAAVELAASGELDPASSVLLAEAAHGVLDEAVASGPVDVDDTLDGISPERTLTESDLSATLRWVLEDPEGVRELRSTEVGGELVTALGGAWFRAQLARRFHNDAVAQAARVRRLWYVRAFHLAGRAPMPHPVDLDDAWPTTLGRPTAAAPQDSAPA